MRKTEAIDLLGGDAHAAAKAIGVTYQAVMKWPPELSDAVTDRVQAALARQLLAPEKLGIAPRRATDKTIRRTSKAEG